MKNLILVMLTLMLMIPSAFAYKGEVVVVGVIKTSYASPESTDHIFLHTAAGGVMKLNLDLGALKISKGGSFCTGNSSSLSVEDKKYQIDISAYFNKYATIAAFLVDRKGKVLSKTGASYIYQPPRPLWIFTPKEGWHWAMGYKIDLELP
jgi:hypothetical protein